MIDQQALNDLAHFRVALADAKAALRLAKDAYETTRAIAEVAAAERLGANLGRNEAERARNLTVELLHDDTHTQALAYLRERESDVDQLHARIAVEEDAIRAAELAARERLAEALLGKRADDAVLDNVDWYEVQNEADRRRFDAIERETAIENDAKGFDIP